MVELTNKDQAMVLVSRLKKFSGLPLPRLISSQEVKLSYLLMLIRLTSIDMKRVRVRRFTFQKHLNILTLTLIPSLLKFNS